MLSLLRKSTPDSTAAGCNHRRIELRIAQHAASQPLMTCPHHLPENSSFPAKTGVPTRNLAGQLFPEITQTATPRLRFERTVAVCCNTARRSACFRNSADNGSTNECGTTTTARSAGFPEPALDTSVTNGTRSGAIGRPGICRIDSFLRTIVATGTVSHPETDSNGTRVGTVVAAPVAKPRTFRNVVPITVWTPAGAI